MIYDRKRCQVLVLGCDLTTGRAIVSDPYEGGAWEVPVASLRADGGVPEIAAEIVKANAHAKAA